MDKKFSHELTPVGTNFLELNLCILEKICGWNFWEGSLEVFMKKIFLIILSIFSLVACISGSIDRIDEAIKVDNRVKVYIDNLSSQDVKAEIKISSSSATFGGITINQNTTGSFIEIDFTKDSTADRQEYYGISLYVTSSDSAIPKRISRKLQ